MRVALLTREYPPDIYGGAGVHVEYLAAELAKLIDVDVHCFGARPTPSARVAGEPLVQGHPPLDELDGANPALNTMGIDLAIARSTAAADLVHSHTWYANLAGHTSGLLHAIPHVATTHSLEPLRPWKAEQLGGGYALSSWCERVGLEGASRVIAVSEGMRADVLEAYPSVDPQRVSVVYNGIDPQLYQPDPRADVLARIGVDLSRPYIAFVGRVTRQKGLPVLLQAAAALRPQAQLVLLAGAADTPELAAEVNRLIEGLQQQRSGVIVVEEMLPRPAVIQVLTHATAFVCPSVYEPLGIVNLEAMACSTAVVASRVGGIPEVVDDGRTGLLVPPSDPAALAAALNRVLDEPGLATAMGAAGRERAVRDFSWGAIAQQTVALYEDVLAARLPAGSKAP